MEASRYRNAGQHSAKAGMPAGPEPVYIRNPSAVGRGGNQTKHRLRPRTEPSDLAPTIALQLIQRYLIPDSTPGKARS